MQSTGTPQNVPTMSNKILAKSKKRFLEGIPTKGIKFSLFHQFIYSYKAILTKFNENSTKIYFHHLMKLQSHNLKTLNSRKIKKQILCKFDKNENRKNNTSDESNVQLLLTK